MDKEIKEHMVREMELRVEHQKERTVAGMEEVISRASRAIKMVKMNATINELGEIQGSASQADVMCGQLAALQNSLHLIRECTK